MNGEVLVVLVPGAAEVLLLGLCLSVALRLRRLGVGGVYQLALAGIALDAVSQGWQLWVRLGRPAGAAWLLHAALCTMVLYVLLRLGHLLARVRQQCSRLEAARTIPPVARQRMAQAVLAKAGLREEEGATE